MTSKILAATALALALTAAPAFGQAAKPVPCTGLQAQDASGDAFVGFIGLLQTPAPAGPNVDFKGLFFRRDNGKITMNAIMTNLDKSIPPDATSIGWRMTYLGPDDVRYYVQTRLDAGTDKPTFSVGHIDGTLVKDADTTGSFSEGPDGVIQVVIPAAQGLKTVGGKIAEVSMFSAYVRGAINTQTDEIPDGEAFAKWTNAECPSGTPEPGTEPSPLPGSTPPPPGSNPNTPASPVQKPGSGSGAATGPLQITVKPTALKAKKVKKSLKLALTCKESLKGLTVQFKKGSKKISSGKLATCAGKATVTLKIKKKLKKGSYTLVFAAKRADTSSGKLTVKVKVS